MRSKQWRRDHPFGFFAKPARTKEGVLDLKNWECGIPGKDKTKWEGGLFKLNIAFPEGEHIRPTQPACNELTIETQSIPRNHLSVGTRNRHLPSRFSNCL